MFDVAPVQRRLGVRADGAFGQVTFASLLTRCGASAKTALALADGLEAVRAAGLLDTGLRLAHFIAQTGHETGGFRLFNELWGPTPAQRRYEGRVDLGNVEPGDGSRYRGRGAIQITGRANYRRYGDLLGLDLIGSPSLAAEPAIGMRIACAYWTARGINEAADRDDVEAVTRKINGGVNGLADRKARLVAAKAVLL